jgi:hypothetical protein
MKARHLLFGITEIPARGGKHEPAVLDALCCDQRIGELLNQCRLAAHQDHFQTVVVIEMDVNARHDRIVVLMLQFRELLR